MCKELRSRALMRLDLPVVGEGEVGKLGSFHSREDISTKF